MAEKCPRKAKLVESVYFAGLTTVESTAALAIFPATAYRGLVF